MKEIREILMEHFAPQEPPKEKCTGVIARLTNNTWYDPKRMSFNQDQRLKILKRDSCKCSFCKAAIDLLKSKPQEGKSLMDCVYYFTDKNGYPLEEGFYVINFIWSGGEYGFDSIDLKPYKGEMV